MWIKLTQDEAKAMIDRILKEWPDILSLPTQGKAENEKIRYRDSWWRETVGREGVEGYKKSYAILPLHHALMWKKCERPQMKQKIYEK